METLKGFARRTTQSLREMVSRHEVTPEELLMADIMTKVRLMETKGEVICEKVIQAARLMGELGTTLREIGEEYKGVPDLPQESRDLASDVFEVGSKLIETSQEHQKGLKDNGFELLRAFSKQCGQLGEVEDARRHHQLEYDFFKAKVQDLRNTPQKDFTRLPRNEQILENWRVELWRATEHSKALCSQLYVDGRQAIDRSVLTTVQVLHSFVGIASSGFEQTFRGVQLPTYSSVPVLPPTPLPAGPAPAPRPSYDGAAPSTPYAPGGYGAAPAMGVPGAPYPGVPAAHGGGSGTAYPSAPPAWSAPPPPQPTGVPAGMPYGDATTYPAQMPPAANGSGGYYPPPAPLQQTRSSMGSGSVSYQPPNVA